MLVLPTWPKSFLMQMWKQAQNSDILSPTSCRQGHWHSRPSARVDHPFWITEAGNVLGQVRKPGFGAGRSLFPGGMWIHTHREHRASTWRTRALSRPSHCPMEPPLHQGTLTRFESLVTELPAHETTGKELRGSSERVRLALEQETKSLGSWPPLLSEEASL